ncbi:IS3 family transposase [Streptomyces sp. NPDC002285]
MLTERHRLLVLTQLLKLPRATYYSWLVSRPAVAERQRAEDELAEEIREIHGKSRGTYGVPRVHAALRRKGHRQSEEGRADHARAGHPGHYPAQAPPPDEAGRQGRARPGPGRARLHRGAARHEARR